MSEPSRHRNEYSEKLVAGLEWIWGEDFLSPGGPDEVAAILEGVSISDADVLDIGCGLGGIDLLLVRDHGARYVVGIDIEQPLIERARRLVDAAGLSGRIALRLVNPGLLPFENGRFDVVFSKDSVIHMPDKTAFYREVLRVLRPGGWFVGSDWLRGGEGEYSGQMKEWLRRVGLTLEMESLEGSRRSLQTAGFVDVALRDRNAWYCAEMETELAQLSGDKYQGLVEAIGEEAAANRLNVSTMRKAVVAQGELRPTHFKGSKPVAA